MPPRPPAAQTSLFGPPAPQPPPALPRWWHVTITDLPATEDGLAELSELLTDMLARDLRFLVALEEHSELHRALREGTPLAEYLRLHQSLLDQLVALRTSSIPATAVPAQVASSRAIDRDLTRLRGALVDSLPPDHGRTSSTTSGRTGSTGTTCSNSWPGWSSWRPSGGAS